MTRLRESTLLDCTADQTQQGLEHFFNSLRKRDGISRFRLRVPVRGATKYGLSLDREVLIQARQVLYDGEVRERFVIAWMPEGSVVFPRFEGTLAIGDESESGHSCIELDGSYTPPFDGTGKIFDADIGHQIAQATAREFLKDLKSAIEARLAGS
ncbi:MAG TPA: hypothetical protein VKR56_14330 [Candidatus Cybelea sp.]|jgi:hypothetical protein|nr:hypothetical protein [Candidatus Cybelea sp.]